MAVCASLTLFEADVNPVSTGLRFTTIPPSAPPLPNPPPVSPPTTLTLLYNPLIGYISSAYSAQIAPSVALSSRFGVNVYSYESDLCIGGEWWVPRRRKPDAEAVHPIETNIAGQVLDGASLRSDEVEDAVMDKELDSPIPLTRAEPRSPVQVPVAMEDERDGVIKARLSGNWVRSVSCMHRADTEGGSLLACSTRQGYATALSRSE